MVEARRRPFRALNRIDGDVPRVLAALEALAARRHDLREIATIATSSLFQTPEIRPRIGIISDAQIS